MRVRVRNFQSIADTTVEVEGLTVLVGPSHRGKSAFLRAVEGVLFNRPGDQFIRVGAKYAEVTIDGLPSVKGAPLQVVWRKGKNANHYTVDGQAFGRVGTGAPPPVEEAGYRDVWIGDRERRKGEYVRPQSANQFEPLFLLTRPGSFISDVLGAISRHTVITAAQGRCGSDLKGTRQLHGTRVGDLRREEERLAAVEQAPVAAGRVQHLAAAYRDAMVEASRVEQLRHLVAARSRLLGLLEQVTPAQVLIEEAVGRLAAYQLASTLAARRRQMAPVAGRLVPEAVVLPESFGPPPEWIQRVRRLRPLLARLVGWVLPSSQVQPERLARLDAASTVLGRGLVEAPRRRRLVPLSARVLPLAGLAPEVLEQCRSWADREETVRRVTGLRALALRGLRDRLGAESTSRVEEEVTQAELGLTLKALKVCPVCERPVEG